MQLRSNLFVVALIGVALLASSASASTVTYILDLSVPNTFTLYADVNSGDNQGLALYSVPLIGSVTNLNNVSPVLFSGGDGAVIGFDQIRQPLPPDPAVGPIVNPEVVGAQNVVSGPISGLISGFGQELSSWAAKGKAGFPTDATADIAWGAIPIAGFDNPLRLATGNYTGSLDFNLTSDNLAANVFTSIAGREAPGAGVNTVVFTGLVIPEPTTLALCGLAMVGALGLRRRR